MTENRSATLRLRDVDAVVFDMDGVVTDTAGVHASAWKRMFDEYLQERAQRIGTAWEPFDEDMDYRRHVDGKPRSDGVDAFLRSRAITLPKGDPSDPPDRETVCGLGARKDGYFLEQLDRAGARSFASTVDLVGRLGTAGVRTAIISASRNMDQVLRSAGVPDLCAVRVNGIDAERLGLRGKPDPAIFLEAARRVGVHPRRTAVVDDAIAGVEAGRRGGFALVIGVDRAGHPEALFDAGADVVVPDLGELRLEGEGSRDDPFMFRTIHDLPSALQHREDIVGLLRGRHLAVFLDYDGTLTPIVDDPARALLPDATRASLERLAAACPLAVISGRDLNDVRTLVGLDGIWYAGSHGFDIAGPGGERHQLATDYIPILDAAESDLRSAVAGIPGVQIERKRSAVAVHYRRTDPARARDVDAAVAEVALRNGKLRRTGGKKVFELRPDIRWDKGMALAFLLDALGLRAPDVCPIYIGDDETDEDAFRAISDTGLGVVLRGEDDERPTCARYALADPSEVPAFFDVLVAVASSA